MLTIMVVSDATGETADRTVRSALVQFKKAQVRITRRGRIRTPERLGAVVREAANEGALIVHTLVSNNLRRLMLKEARAYGVESIDLMGPVLDRLALQLGLTPREKPGLFKQLVEAKSREIEAVEFAFKHDDGQHVEDLNKAEIVLVGVSRVMKTPVMLYLAYRGWFAANVPLVLEISPPKELLRLPSKRVFCLVTSPHQLQELRRARAGISAIPEVPYASMQHIREELLYARRFSRNQGWKQIEVTGKSVEEVAREIIMLHARRKRGSPIAW